MPASISNIPRRRFRNNLPNRIDVNERVVRWHGLKSNGSQQTDGERVVLNRRRTSRFLG